VQDRLIAVLDRVNQPGACRRRAIDLPEPALPFGVLRDDLWRILRLLHKGWTGGHLKTALKKTVGSG